MQVSVSIGQNHHFELREALLIYRSSEHQYGHLGDTFVTHHEVTQGDYARQPALGPAKPLTIEFVHSLVQALGGRVQVEFLPESVIARTERLIAWWTRPQKRQMFFGTTQGDMGGINGAIFPQPALVWLAMDRSLSVRALKEDRRPRADTKLCVAPYWNLYETGNVCLGSMRAPDNSTVASIPQWEQSFYESEFTHGNIGRLTRHPGGFEGLWMELAGKKKFPVGSLIELPETVEEFLCGKRRGHDD
ncbi:MAG: PRTRC system protein B [Acidobacteriota bacterium]|nr:PRTRC system protein B [Acidobacteriota bacterium]